MGLPECVRFGYACCMKSVLATVAIMVASIIARADEKEVEHPLLFPAATVEIVLMMLHHNEGKTLVVEDRAILNEECQLLFREGSKEQLRSVIETMLMLNGLKVTEEGDELFVRKVLTPEQITAMNKAIGRDQWPPVGKEVPRMRITPPREGAPAPPPMEERPIQIRPPKKPAEE